MQAIDPILKRSPRLREAMLKAKKIASHRDFEKARIAYKEALAQAEEEFSPISADYGLILLEVADFYESFGRDLTLYGIRCKIRAILKRYATSYIYSDAAEEKIVNDRTEAYFSIHEKSFKSVMPS